MSEPSPGHDLLAVEILDAAFAVRTLLRARLLVPLTNALSGRQPVACLPS
jgi:hypothetical protein